PGGATKPREARSSRPAKAMQALSPCRRILGRRSARRRATLLPRDRPVRLSQSLPGSVAAASSSRQPIWRARSAAASAVADRKANSVMIASRPRSMRNVVYQPRPQPDDGDQRDERLDHHDVEAHGAGSAFSAVTVRLRREVNKWTKF